MGAEILIEAAAPATEEIACRLCCGRAKKAFSAVFMRKLDVDLFRCVDCDSLQTTEPTWLDEAYADLRPVRDVWMASRTLRMRTLTLMVMRLLRMSGSKVFDWGGGNGLLVRLLRDVGVDAYRSDKYVSNFYAVGFDVKDGETADLMTAFEVFEHSENPRALMTDITARSPKAILLSTELYRGQGPDWHYLHMDSGKHVFFYSHRGLEALAADFGYRALVTPRLSLFFKMDLPKWRLALIRRLLLHFNDGKLWAHLAEFALSQSYRGTDADFSRLNSGPAVGRSKFVR